MGGFGQRGGMAPSFFSVSQSLEHNFRHGHGEQRGSIGGSPCGFENATCGSVHTLSPLLRRVRGRSEPCFNGSAFRLFVQSVIHSRIHFVIHSERVFA